MVYDKHVFVCQNTKEGKPSCAPRGGEAIGSAMKELQKAHPALKRVRINKSGCLGLCEEGPTVVVYPEGTWYTGVTLDDVPDIVNQHLAQDQVVTRIQRGKK